MIDNNIFTTQVTALSANGKSGQGNNVLGGNALFGITENGGLDFLSALLGNLEAPEGEVKNEKSANNNVNTSTTVKNEKTDLALLQLALLGQDADKSLEEKLGELKIEQLANTKENRITQLTKMIEHLTSGLPEQTIQTGTIENLVNRLEKRLATLETNLDTLRIGEFQNDDAPFKALIATGLNPAQLTKITERIQEVENKLGRELTVEDLIAGVGNIIPAAGDEDHEFAVTDSLSILITQSQKNNEEQRLELEKKLAQDIEKEISDTNNQNIGLGGAVNTLLDNQSSLPQSNPVSSNINGLVDGKDATTNLPLNAVTEEIAARLSNGDYKALFGASKKINASLAKMDLSNGAALANNAAATQTNPSLLTFNFSQTLASATILGEALGFDIQTGAPFNIPMQAAAMVSANAQAGQTHPATQMVAAQITKSAANGETKQMTLRLDPPELGRVEIRLEFGDERMVKANIIVEKPETLLMLQRDANALERALQNAGLETDSGSLDFSMAEDGHDFNSDRDGDSRNGGTGNSDGANDNEELELIETNMTWDVDPQTGHVHYNILA